MAKFSDLGIEPDVIVGKGVEIQDLFDKRILIEKTIIQESKFPGKNTSGLRMQMQVVYATFNDKPDKDGDYFTKGSDGNAVGERHSCFTGSDILISAIQRAEANMPQMNKQRAEHGEPPLHLYPIDTTIVKVGKCFQFT